MMKALLTLLDGFSVGGVVTVLLAEEARHAFTQACTAVVVAILWNFFEVLIFRIFFFL